MEYTSNKLVYPRDVQLAEVSDGGDGGGQQQLLPCHLLSVGQVYQCLQGREHKVLVTIFLSKIIVKK